MKTLTPKVLGLPKQLVADLLVVMESPRWHLLSWVLDWPMLEERCLSLKANPELKNPGSELKYLVIDYTQFDDWSSDEEVNISSGIEKGYERWDVADVDVDVDEVIEERGLIGEEGEFDFNIVQKLEEDTADEFYDAETPQQVLCLNFFPDLPILCCLQGSCYGTQIEYINVQHCNMFSLPYT